MSLMSRLGALGVATLLCTAAVPAAQAQPMDPMHRPMMHHRMMHHDRMMMHHDRMMRHHERRMMHHDRMMMRHHRMMRHRMHRDGM